MTDRVALVTGGSGFLGGHMAERLAEGGWTVRVLDVREPQLTRGVDWVQADIRDAESVISAAAGVDVVFHFATTVGVDRILADPAEGIDVTVNGALNVLDAAGRSGAAVVHLSTSEVLGLNPDLPWAEDSERHIGSALTDRWSYASAKAAAEHLMLAGGNARRIPVTVVRPFNVYGPRQEPRFVIPIMVAAALRGDPIPIHDDGRQTRCFTYVDDVVDALETLAGKPGCAPVLHIGSSDEISISDLAILVDAAVGGGTATVYERPAERWGGAYQDLPRRVPDTSLARGLLAWSPEVTLEEGLVHTVDWTSASVPGSADRAV